MRRWVRTGVIDSHFVEFNGAAVKSVKSGFRSPVGLAKVEVLLDTYGHHHPEFLREAAAAIPTKPSKNIVSGVDRGVDLAAYRERRRKA